MSNSPGFRGGAIGSAVPASFSSSPNSDIPRQRTCHTAHVGSFLASSSIDSRFSKNVGKKFRQDNSYCSRARQTHEWLTRRTQQSHGSDLLILRLQVLQAYARGAGTSKTGRVLCLSTPLVALPTSRLYIASCPWVPMTIKSALIASPWLRISSATAPVGSCSVTLIPACAISLCHCASLDFCS